MQDAEEWLEEWVEENLVNHGYHENPSDMEMEASACREAARAAGITDAALTSAAGGNLEGYLLREQNAVTDAEVRRLAERDD